MQPQADKQTDILVRDVLSGFHLSEDDIETILRLIKATETYESNEEDEIILVDADNLSKTSPDHIKEKYAKSDWLNMCDLFEEKLPLRIKTDQAKKLLPAKLIECRKILESELKLSQ